MVSILAQKTIKRVADALEVGESAGLNEIVELIQQLSSNADNTSVEELSAIIGKDLVVTAKVITAANMIGYNPSGIVVSTISQATQVIGFNKIRQLAVSLLMIESAERTLNPSEKREIAALALCSGMLAESIMGKRGTHSTEHAFICASLRNYGRLLMTTFMIDEYRQARIMATEGLAEDQAFDQIFGLTPLELGYHLLASAHLPDTILKSLQKLPPDAIKRATSQPDVEILLLSDLSVQLCELAFRSDLTVADFEKRAQALVVRSGRVFDLDLPGMIEVLKETAQQLTTFATAFGLTSLAQDFTPRLRARVNRQEPVAPPLGSSLSPVAPPNPASVATSTPSGNRPNPVSTPPTVEGPLTPAVASIPGDSSRAATTSNANDGELAFQQAIDSGIEQLTDLLDRQPVDLRKVYNVVIKSALQGFAAHEGIIFVREQPNRPYTVAFGSGGLFERLAGKSLIRETDRDVFGLALQRMEDVLISDASEPKISVHLPDWVKTSKLASFILLPLHENRRPFAMILVSWNQLKSVGFTPAQLRQVRSMLRLVGTARRLAAI